MKQQASYISQNYEYSSRIGNLRAEAVGIVKGEKHFPIFSGNLVYIKEHYPKVTKLFLENWTNWKQTLEKIKKCFTSRRARTTRIMQIPMPTWPAKPDIKTMMKKKLRFTKLSMVEVGKRYILIS